MPKKSYLLTFLLAVISLLSIASETLNLTWVQPPGYTSTLYGATNLDGDWTSLGVVNPPVQVKSTNQVAFFYVSVTPSTSINPDVIYISDPNGEHLTPEYTNAPAIAYDENGYVGIYVWSPKEQRWN